MPELAPGDYLLALSSPAGGPPVKARPALAGLVLPDTGPPDDVIRQYLQKAGAEEAPRKRSRESAMSRPIVGSRAPRRGRRLDLSVAAGRAIWPPAPRREAAAAAKAAIRPGRRARPLPAALGPGDRLLQPGPAGDKAGKPGPEDHPERFVRMAPAHPGAWTWVDARTLQFKPAEPWPPLQRFSFTVAPAATTLDTLISPPAKTLPAEGEEVADPVKTITLSFPEPLDPQTLGRMLSIEVRPLPGVARGAGASRRRAALDHGPRLSDQGAGPQGAQRSGDLRADAGDADAPGLECDPPLPPLPGRSLARVVARPGVHHGRAVPRHRRGLPGARVPVTPGGTRYGREQPLRCRPDDRQVIVELSAAPVSLGPIEGRNLVRFEPAVSGLAFEVSGRQLLVSGGFQRETLYCVSLAPGAAAAAVVDNHGRRLDLRGPTEAGSSSRSARAICAGAPARGSSSASVRAWRRSKGAATSGSTCASIAIDPLDRSLWPFPDSPVTVDESRAAPRPGRGARSPGGAGARRAGLGAGAAPPDAGLAAGLDARHPAAAPRGQLRPLRPRPRAVPRQAGSRPDSPGTYLVGLRRLDRSSQRSWIRVQVTDLTLTAAEEPRAVVFSRQLALHLAAGGRRQGAGRGLPRGVRQGAALDHLLRRHHRRRRPRHLEPAGQPGDRAARRACGGSWCRTARTSSSSIPAHPPDGYRGRAVVPGARELAGLGVRRPRPTAGRRPRPSAISSPSGRSTARRMASTSRAICAGASKGELTPDRRGG